VWSVLVELTARDVLGGWRATHQTLRDRIPVRVWLTAPGESARVSWRMARTGIPDASVVREITEQCATARDLLAVALPGHSNRRKRRQITRRLSSGVLDPGVLSHLIATTTDPDVRHTSDLHTTVLHTIASGTLPGAPSPDDVPTGEVLPGEVSAVKVPVDEVSAGEVSAGEVSVVDVPADEVAAVKPTRKRAPRRSGKGGAGGPSTPVRPKDRSDEVIADAIRVAIEAGRLPAHPSVNAARIEAGVSWERAAQVLTAMGLPPAPKPDRLQKNPAPATTAHDQDDTQTRSDETHIDETHIDENRSDENRTDENRTDVRASDDERVEVAA
jgi:hypothetical protein